MSSLLTLPVFPLLMFVGLPAFATSLVTNEDQSRALTLLRPSSRGEIVVDHATLGRQISRILSGADVPELTSDDRANLLASFMNIWQVKTSDKDWTPGALDRSLSNLRSECVFEDFPENEKLRRSFANLRIALLVVEAHRQWTSLVENEPLRETFAHLAFSLILSVFERRAEGVKMPSDEQLISFLTQLRNEAGPESRATWWQLVDLMRREMDGSIGKSVENAGTAWVLNGLFYGLVSGMSATVATLTLGMANLIDIRYFGGAGSVALATAPISTAAVGVGSTLLTKTRRQRKVRARAEVFVESCHAALVQ